MPAPKKKLHVLLVDDHPMLREGLRACLSAEPGVHVVGEAGDGAEGLRQTRLLQPDLVLMDVNMPRVGGLEAMAILRRKFPSVRVLALTMHKQPEYVAQLIRAGAHGYVSKDATPAEIIKAIDCVGRGGIFFADDMAQLVLRTQIDAVGGKTASGLEVLTAREREVLGLIAAELSNKQIAARLNVGVRTVETHRERLMRKLDIHSVAGLTRFAVAHGLISVE
jgi:two-component system, NarL family, nitrate/nitrite response regulator NarL